MVSQRVGPNTSVSPQAAVWFVTGCSTGFGLALARQAISHGDRTVITARDPAQLKEYAGIGYFAAIEEAEVRKMFEVNVFGLNRRVQAVLPGMRKRGSGCIVNLSSIGQTS